MVRGVSFRGAGCESGSIDSTEEMLTDGGWEAEVIDFAEGVGVEEVDMVCFEEEEERKLGLKGL